MNDPGPPDRLLEASANPPVQPDERQLLRVCRYPGRRQLDPIEPAGRIEHGRETTLTHVIARRPYRLQRSPDVERCPRQHIPKVVRGTVPQVDACDHGESLGIQAGGPSAAARCRDSGQCRLGFQG